jgi:hypothetical protein
MQPIRDPGGAFTFSVPDDWEPAQGEGGSVSAAAPDHGSSVLALAQLRKAESLDDQVKYTRAALQRAMPSWTPTAQEPRRVSGHPAFLIRSLSNVTGAPMLGEHLMVYTDRHEVTMSLSYPQSAAPAMGPVAAAILASLRLAGPD